MCFPRLELRAKKKFYAYPPTSLKSPISSAESYPISKKLAFEQEEQV